MLEYSPSARKKVNTLHGTSAAGPSNYRDASNPTGPWKNAPTPIAVPPQMRNPRFDLASPYEQMKDTLRRGQAPRPGNPNTHATLLGTGRQPRPPDPKRSQPDLPFSHFTRRNNNSHPANNTHPSSRHGGHPTSCTSDAEIQMFDPRGIKSVPAHGRPPRDSEIEVISDGEDRGVPLPRPPTPSPDELQLIDQRRRHDFETHPGGHQHANPPKGKGKEAATKPQAVTSVVSDIEEIDDFTSEPANERPSPSRPPQSQRAAKLTPSLRAIRPGNVAKKCELYEPEPQPKPTHVDLRHKDALSGRPGVAANMKLNRAPKLVSSTLQLDPIATESTLFTSKWHSRTKEHPLKLPLRAWAMGLKIFFAEEGSDPPAFEYNPRNGHLDVSVPGQSRPYRFQYPTGFDEIT
ncbi:hypothetical protein M405DRAFT_568256 [Rhizopogon salebrosus TDB-379]|nr:hypothetical protein M405DRAFT_568256 [Rhizopogon salebrosus TDB-379]